MIGRRIGQYEILAELGAGGMAVVYRAYQSAIDRDVAIKVIKPERRDDGEFLKRFQREARTIASLSHPHIVKVFDYGEHEGTVYLVMELLKGGSLADIVSRGPMPLNKVADLFDQIGPALDYAHERGIIHRDLKPQNVLLDERGNAYITDFGLARLLESGTTLTQSGAALGTPAYMSPEQWLGSELDSRADIYSLGVMLYEMLSGKLPFQADTPYAMMHKAVDEPPPPLHTLRPDMPPDVENVVERVLAKDPRQRYPTAGDLAEQLRGALSATLPALRAAEQATEVAERAAIQRTATPELRAETAITEGTARRRRNVVIAAGAVLALAMVALLLFGNGGLGNAGNVPNATSTASSQAVAVIPTANFTPTFMPAETHTATATPTAIVAPSQTPIPLVLATVTPRPSDTPTMTPTRRTGLKIGVVQGNDFGGDPVNANSLDGAKDAARILNGTVETFHTDIPPGFNSSRGADLDAAASYAAKGFDIVIITDFLDDLPSMRQFNQITDKYPRTHFFIAIPFPAHTANVTAYLEPTEDILFMAGALAASLSKTGTIALIAAASDSLSAIEPIFKAGAQYVNPKIKLVTSSNPNKSYEDTAWGAQAAREAIKQGADVLLANGGNVANAAYLAFSVASTDSKPLYCIGAMEDARTYNQEAQCIVSSVVALHGPKLRDAILKVADGAHEVADFNVDFGLTPFGRYEGMLPDSALQKLKQLQAALQRGDLKGQTR